MGMSSTLPIAKLNAGVELVLTILKKLKHKGADTREKLTVVNKRLGASVE